MRATQKTPDPIDLELFHRKYPGRPWIKDPLNRKTGFWSCFLLECIGWYNFDVEQRLLGHYRQYQIFLKKNKKYLYNMAPERSYILQYRSTQKIRYWIACSFGFLYSIFTRGERNPGTETAGINRILTYDRCDILIQFLQDAEIDFTPSFDHALQLIQHPDFLNTSAVPAPQPPPIIIHPQPSPAATGKEKDVFSKKQFLLLLDLLCEHFKIKKIDLSKRNKLQNIAKLLQAITGKARQSWVEELKDYEKKDLYAYDTPGQLAQLIRDLVNIRGFLSDAGLTDLIPLIDTRTKNFEKIKRALDK